MPRMKKMRGILINQAKLLLKEGQILFTEKFINFDLFVAAG